MAPPRGRCCQGVADCPVGHELQPGAAPHGVCDGCGRPVPCSKLVMACKHCDWCLCAACHPQQARGRAFWDQLLASAVHTLVRARQDLERMAADIAIQCTAVCEEQSGGVEVVVCSHAFGHDYGCPPPAATLDDPSTRYTDHALERLIHELFCLQDLNKNGTLEEKELVQLNKKIALAHYGKDVDMEALNRNFQELFRTRLADGAGRSASYASFRRYTLEVLEEMDPDLASQVLILEQFIAEAALGRTLFHEPVFRRDSDASFVSKISLPEKLSRRASEASTSTPLAQHDRVKDADDDNWNLGELPKDEWEGNPDSAAMAQFEGYVRRRQPFRGRGATV